MLAGTQLSSLSLFITCGVSTHRAPLPVFSTASLLSRISSWKCPHTATQGSVSWVTPYPGRSTEIKHGILSQAIVLLLYGPGVPVIRQYKERPCDLSRQGL